MRAVHLKDDFSYFFFISTIDAGLISHKDKMKAYTSISKECRRHEILELYFTNSKINVKD